MTAYNVDQVDVRIGIEYNGSYVVHNLFFYLPDSMKYSSNAQSVATNIPVAASAHSVAINIRVATVIWKLYALRVTKNCTADQIGSFYSNWDLLQF